MTNSAHKIKSILLYLVPSLLSNFLPLITFPIITRFLSPEDFGVTALIMNATTIMASFLACSVDAATQRYYFEYRKNVKDLDGLINSSLIYFLSIYLISLPFVYFLGDFISKIITRTPKYSFAIFISYIGSCLYVLVNYYLMLYRNMEKAKYFSFFTLCQMIAGVILTLVFVAIFKLGFIGLIYSTFFSSLIAFTVLFVRFKKAHPLCFNKKMLVDNLKYGLQLLPNFFTSSVYQFFDKYMLGNMVSLSSTGFFSIGQNVSNKFFVFMTAVQSTFDPIFMKDIFEKGKQGCISVGRNFTVFSYISLSAILLGILFCEEMIYILAPSKYYQVINVLMILLLGISLQTFGKIVGPQLAYAKKVYIIFPVSVIGLIVNIVLNLLFIPRWGAIGAAIAWTVTILVINSICVIIAQKAYKIIYENGILLLIYLNILMSMVLLIYLRSVAAAVWVKYCIKISALLFYVFIGIRSQILTKEKISTLLSLVTFKKGKNYFAQA